MIIFIKREDTYRLMCAFDTEKKIYCKGNFAGHYKHDLMIFTAQVHDVEITIQRLDALGFSEVTEDVFLKDAVHMESGLPLGEHIRIEQDRLAAQRKAQDINSIALHIRFGKDNADRIDESAAEKLATDLYEKVCDMSYEDRNKAIDEAVTEFLSKPA